jgi:septal ring factor EnvC (AmiA/AmiB activator)
VGQRKQLWILLSVFVGMGLFAGLTMWQISQTQQKDRAFSQVKIELDQVKKQLESSRSSQNGLVASQAKIQKQLTVAQQKRAELEKQHQVDNTKLLEASKLQDKYNDLVGEHNKLIKERQDLAEKYNALLKESQKNSSGASGSAKSSTKDTLTIPPNPFK